MKRSILTTKTSSDFTSVLHTGLKHKNKQIFCSAQLFQTAWLYLWQEFENMQLPQTASPDFAREIDSLGFPEVTEVENVLRHQGYSTRIYLGATSISWNSKSHSSQAHCSCNSITAISFHTYQQYQDQYYLAISLGLVMRIPLSQIFW